jgi:DNA mismatch endonuclease (patch repair protein)
VHGCFWHQHQDPDCPVARRPSSNTTYWSEKFTRNRERDRQTEKALRSADWDVLTIWECELIDVSDLEHKLVTFLGKPGPSRE